MLAVTVFQEAGCFLLYTFLYFKEHSVFYKGNFLKGGGMTSFFLQNQSSEAINGSFEVQ